MTPRDIEDFVTQRLRAAPFDDTPYPHLFIDNVFPEDFYRELLANFPTDSEFIRDDDYRFGLPVNETGFLRLSATKREFWREFSGWLLAEPFMRSVANLFLPALMVRFADRPNASFTCSASLGRTKSSFVLGPHTDMQHRVISIVFYLPQSDRTTLPGTSIYEPRDKTFQCPGGPHYGFENFRKLATIQFKPNTAFAFFKTPISFHGVEPWAEREFVRDTMQFEIHDADRAYYYGPAR